MTNKRNRFYQIGFAISTIICIGLLAFMGITAIQKSMTLKMQFEVSPAVAVKLEIYNTTTTQWDVVFQNSGQVQIKDGVTLNGNTLGLRSEFANGLGNSFSLKITSLSSSKILAELSGASYSQSKLIFTNSTPQTVEVDAVDNLTIDFSKVVQVSIQDSSNGGLTLASENLVEFTQDQQTTYYAQTHQALVLVYDMNSSHKNHSIEATISDKTVGEITTENNQMTLSIPATALTGSVSVTLSAEMNQIQVSYNLTNLNISNVIVRRGEDFTTTLILNSDLNTVYSAENTLAYTIPNYENIIITITPKNSNAITLEHNAETNGYTYIASENAITITISADVLEQLFIGNLGTITLSAYAPRYVISTYLLSGYWSNDYITNTTIVEGQTFVTEVGEGNFAMYDFGVQINDNPRFMLEACEGVDLVVFDARSGAPYDYSGQITCPSSIFSEGEHDVFGDVASDVASVKFYFYMGNDK